MCGMMKRLWRTRCATMVVDWNESFGTSCRVWTDVMKRRRFVHGSGLVLVLVVLMGPAAASAQSPGHEATMQFFMNSTDGQFGSLYLLSGGARHSLAIGAEDETIIIDTKRSQQWAQPMLEKIANVSDQPVKRIINTNAWNSGSNAEFGEVAEIIAHENTKAFMESMESFRGANARFLPNRTFTDTLSIPVNTSGEATGKNRIDLLYMGPGHTNGDVVVVMPMYSAVFLGDLFPDKATPVIDVDHGGSGVAFPDTLDKIVMALDGYERIDVVVPGQVASPPVPAMSGWWTMADLREYAEFNRSFLDSVRASFTAGQTVDEAVAALDLPEKFAEYGMSHAHANVQAIYAELQE